MEGSKNATELGVKQVLCKWPERKEIGIIELDRQPGRGREKNIENVHYVQNVILQKHSTMSHLILLPPEDKEYVS